jgi:hypothetical protein
VPLYALLGGNRVRARRDGPRRAWCPGCGAEMRAKTGFVVTWHWAHLAQNPACAIASESEWHLAWKALGLDGSQEVVVGRRRADVLAPGGFAVEFQASALDRREVQAREDEWAIQGGMAWVFKADRARIEVREFFPDAWKCLLAENNLATLKITWLRAPERVRAARAPSFLDLGGGELLFVGGWHRRSSPLTGYGWRVSRDWVVQNLLRSEVMPFPLADHPAEVKRRVEAWQQGEERETRAARERTGWRPRQRNLRAERLIVAAGDPWPDEDLTGAEVWAQVLSPLRGDPGAAKSVWAMAVRASGRLTPTAGALRRARQEYGRARSTRTPAAGGLKER